MATAQDRAKAKDAFSGAGPARKYVAAFLADYLYDYLYDKDDMYFRQEELLEDMGLVAAALSPAQHERFLNALDYIVERLDKMAGRAPAAE